MSPALGMKLTDNKPHRAEAGASRGKLPWMQHAVLGAACLLVIGVYVCAAHTDVWESWSLNAADNYYNLLVRGFRDGQLNLRKDVPPGLVQLRDPYDPVANADFRVGPDRLHDMSYYKGRLYLYFGVTPALILLWPFTALTGQFLSSAQAAAFFCTMGFLTCAGVVRALWRRYFPEASIWVVAAVVMAVGLGTGVPIILPRSGVYEVAVSCGYMLTMLSLGAIWCALHEPEQRRRCWWLAAASLSYGLAIGARPSLLFGAVILLAPVVQVRCERRPAWPLLTAAIGPIALIGLGMMMYNAMRFDSPFEFGQHYQLTAYQMTARQFFHLRYLWFNFRVYFLEPVSWSGRFPFVHEVPVRPLPPGYLLAESPFGVLTNLPLVWAALVVPLAWGDRPEQAGSILRRFAMAVALLFGASALSLGFYFNSAGRYQMDFLPALVLLAALGVFGLERALADRLVWRRSVCWGWGLLLCFSVVVSLSLSAVHCAETDNSLGLAWEKLGNIKEAVGYFDRSLFLNPDYAEAHGNLGTALIALGEPQEALQQFEKSVQLRPDWAPAHYNLGVALEQVGGRMQESIDQYQQTLRIDPDYAEAHYHLGNALARSEKLEDAVRQYQEALRLRPDYAEAHLNLGAALAKLGKPEEAIQQYQEAVRIQPNYAAAHNSLANAFARAGKVEEAIQHYEQALQIDPSLGGVHYNLGTTLEHAGRVPEAIQHYEQVLKLQPDFTPAKNALARLQGSQ